MYILCKKDFNHICFDFKKDVKYPITNILTDAYCFCYPNGQGGTISKSYLKEKEEYLEFVDQKSCSHKEEIEIYCFVICKECQELIKVKP